MDERNIALEAIRKKLIGKKLSYQEIYAIMDEISNKKLGDILSTYFVASGYSKGFSNEEIYHLTRAMVETGEKLHFRGIVADKHSIGGIPGTRVTLITVPIIASAGFKIPKSSSRAITTPAGTADAMEVLSDVTFNEKEIYKIVEQTRGCIVWGGSFKIAPADDEIIRIEEPLLFESYDKILVSVMAKKIAFGSNHVIIDLPYGKTVKIRKLEDAKLLGEKFKYLAHKFNIKLEVSISKADQPAGSGIGPLLEAREALKVLEQVKEKPLLLEEKALQLSSQLLELCVRDSASIKKDMLRKYKNTEEWAKDILKSGKALLKMKEIIKAQRGDPNITSSDLHPGEFSFNVKAEKTGKISFIDNKNLTIIAKILGAPQNKKAGIYIHKKLGEIIEKGELAYTLYSESRYKLNEALDSLSLFPLFKI
ncbi:MAG: hypothetical protein A2857_02655 [Candidatus Levybacteria bacterium RIFCSPHIGHO2_01_FULL_36_15]|nr:MAG: hypothetical protein A2857_02655 [Candidatus Levybacteria bacterium RIFCSPHIGHO2_01_FULL_36_15]OGH38598.1 MAG: hypothetical protein A2905_03145 [Candidatus Levybacteria bacterium RIFCSPLOWO2_01_FULL_36_10]